MKKSLLLLFTLQLSLNGFGQNTWVELPLNKNFNTLDKRGISGIAVDDTGRVWLSHYGYWTSAGFRPSGMGLTSMGSDSVWTQTVVDPNGGLPSNYLSSIQFKNGSLWMGSNVGLIKKTGNQYVVYAHPENNSSQDTVNNFLLEGSTYYMATQTGVHIYNPSPGKALWRVYHPGNSSLPTSKIYAIDKEKNGILWLGTNIGVVRFDPNTNTSKLFNHSNSAFWCDTILSIKVLPDGSVWAGTLEYRNKNNGDANQLPGLFGLVGDHFENLLSITGLCNDGIIPADPFCQINNEENNLEFGGNFIDRYGNYYSAWFSLHETNLSYINREFKSRYSTRTFQTKHHEYYYFVSNYNETVIALKPKQIQSDSSFYWSNHMNSPVILPENFESEAVLNLNHLQAPLNIKGDMFTFNNKNLSSSSTQCKPIAFAASLWMGGMCDGNLHTAANTYRQQGIDYTQGPLQIGSATTNLKTRKAFSYFFKTEEREINSFRQNFNKPGYQIPASILNWPAHGDSMSGYAPNLAPFEDLNQNGTYEPQLGEFPKVQGQQNYFWIFNDSNTFHSESEGHNLGIEVQANGYAYVCDQLTEADSNRALNNSIFIKYKIINRSQRTYTNFMAGFWVSSFLGNYTNDLAGSNPKEGYAYWYNGDTLDGGAYGYGNKQPACALVMLKGFKDSSGNTTGPSGMISFATDFSNQGFPSRPEHFYNYLDGRWKDGAPLTYGAKGKGGSDSNTVWMYPGNDDPLHREAWFDSLQTNNIMDKNILLKTGKITLRPNEEQEIEFALVYSPTQSNQRDLVLSRLNHDVLKVKQWYKNKSFPTCSNSPLSLEETPNIIKNTNQLTLYPNPGNGLLNLAFSNHNPIYEIKVYDIAGKLLFTFKGQQLKQIDLSSLPVGMYLIQAFTDNTIATERWLKNE